MTLLILDYRWVLTEASLCIWVNTSKHETMFTSMKHVGCVACSVWTVLVSKRPLFCILSRTLQCCHARLSLWHSAHPLLCLPLTLSSHSLTSLLSLHPSLYLCPESNRELFLCKRNDKVTMRTRMQTCRRTGEIHWEYPLHIPVCTRVCVCLCVLRRVKVMNSTWATLGSIASILNEQMASHMHTHSHTPTHMHTYTHTHAHTHTILSFPKSLVCMWSAVPTEHTHRQWRKNGVCSICSVQGCHTRRAGYWVNILFK